MRYTRLVAEIRVRPIFTCAGCGREAVGETVTMSVDTDQGQTIEQALAVTPGPGYMPVGWASFGRRNIKCPECYSHE